MKVIFTLNNPSTILTHSSVFYPMTLQSVPKTLFKSTVHIEQLAPFCFWFIDKPLLEKGITNDLQQEKFMHDITIDNQVQPSSVNVNMHASKN